MTRGRLALSLRALAPLLLLASLVGLAWAGQGAYRALAERLPAAREALAANDPVAAARALIARAPAPARWTPEAPIAAFARADEALARLPERASRLGDLAAGRALYLASCAACHGIGGRGDGSASELVYARPRDLADPSAMNQRTDDELHRVIREGGLAVGRSWLMPRFGGELDAVGQWDLVAYVRALHPSVTDLAPAAARWETREVVLPRAGAPGLDALRADERRVVWFIARDAAGGALGEVAFAPLDAARADSTATSAASPGTTPRWIGVLDAPSGEPLAERAFVGARPLEGRPSSSADDASIAAAAARLRRRVRAARGHLEQERARAEERLAAWRAAPAALGRGERLFLELCASCHGATGQRFGGVTRVGPDVVPARNLADPAVTRARTDDELARLVREGGLAVGISAQMPGAPHLDTAELQDLVRFVRALGDGQGEGPP